MNGYDSIRPAEDSDTRVNIKEYQKTIGSLMYAMTNTRPDIAFALGKLSQYMSDPAEHHNHGLKALLRYLRSTISLGLQYGNTTGLQTDSKLTMYTDADWASEKGRKSTSGNVGIVNAGPATWNSKKQRNVTTSSCEAEYVAMSSAAKQGQWLSNILRDIGYGCRVGTNQYCFRMKADNQGAIALAQNPHLHERSKHIDICYHYTRDLVKEGKVRIDYVPTKDMAADGFTRPLTGAAFTRFVSMIGMKAGPEDV
jgi:hypothetical protein